MKSPATKNSNVPTPSQIREFLCHGRGSRKVRVRRDGTIQFYGCVLPGRNGFPFWQECGRLNDYVVNARGEVRERPARGRQGRVR